MAAISKEERARKLKFAKAYVKSNNVSARKAEKETGMGKIWFLKAKRELGMVVKEPKPELDVMDSFSWQAKGLTLPMNQLIKAYRS